MGIILKTNVNNIGNMILKTTSKIKKQHPIVVIPV